MFATNVTTCRFDFDKDGFLSHSDMEKAAVQFGLVPFGEDLGQVVQQLTACFGSSDSDGVSFDEFKVRTMCTACLLRAPLVGCLLVS